MGRKIKDSDSIQLETDKQFLEDALKRIKCPIMRYRLTMIFDAMTECFAEAELGSSADPRDAVVRGIYKIGWPRATIVAGEK